MPTSASVFPPGKPTVRRVKTVTLQPGRAQTVTQACEAGDRLISVAHAFGVYGPSPPPAREVAAMTARGRVHGDAVSVTARAGIATAGSRTVIQVMAVCAGGR